MIHLTICHATRCLSFLSPLLLTLSLLLAPSMALAAAVGDQVELTATHQAGIPFHHAPRATPDFQRLPDGTRAHVIGVAQDGRWLKLSLSDGRTGWVTSRYVRTSAPGSPAPETPPAATKPQRIEEGTVTSVADGDTLTVTTLNQTKLRIRMFGIDAPETPKGAQFPGQPFGKEAEVYLRQLVEGKRVTVEMYQVDRVRHEAQ
jgi:Staphylococcal nuclease homologue